MPRFLKILTVIVTSFLLISLAKKTTGQSQITVTINVIDTTLTVTGKTSPLAFVTILDSTTVIGTETADSSGNFEKSFTAQTGGIHSIGVYGRDTDGRLTDTVTTNVSLYEKAETVLSVFLPPVIALAVDEANQGDALNLSGQTHPSSTVTLVLDDTNNLTTLSDTLGRWSYSLSTTSLSLGTHNIYAKTTDGLGNISSSTTKRTFTVTQAPTATPTPGVGPTSTPAPVPTATPTTGLTPTPTCGIADLNCDGLVDGADLSILLVNWGRPTTTPRADINQDTVVNIVDFSIMMYYWTG